MRTQALRAVVAVGLCLLAACAEHSPEPARAPAAGSCPAVVSATASAPAAASASVAAESSKPKHTTLSGNALPDGEWKEREASGLVFHFMPTTEPDVDRFAGHAAAFLGSMAKEFAPLDTTAAMSGPVACHVYLIGEESKLAGPGRAGSKTSTGGNKPPHCEIFMMPSHLFPKDRRCCTNVGEAYDEHYDHKVFVHELAGILLGRLNLHHGKWELFSAPDWFHQGFEEYLAVHFGSEHAKNVTLGLFRKKVAADPGRIAYWGVENEYLDGTILIEFLHQTFGSKKVNALITSQAQTFDEAVQRELGVNEENLLRRWYAWKAKHLTSKSATTW